MKKMGELVLCGPQFENKQNQDKYLICSIILSIFFFYVVNDLDKFFVFNYIAKFSFSLQKYMLFSQSIKKIVLILVPIA